jgi:SAP domain
VVNLNGWQIAETIEIKQELNEAEDNDEFFSIGNEEERQQMRFTILKVYKLKEECKSRGLIQSGIKKDIVKRLVDYKLSRGRTAIKID